MKTSTFFKGGVLDELCDKKSGKIVKNGKKVLTDSYNRLIQLHKVFLELQKQILVQGDSGST